MRVIPTVTCLALLATAMGCSGTQNDGTHGKQAVVNGTITGTVKYVDLEGGFYGIVTDAGQKLDPVNLPDSLKIDGLRIRARVEKAQEQVSTHMWGPRVRIVQIERL